MRKSLVSLLTSVFMIQVLDYGHRAVQIDSVILIDAFQTFKDSLSTKVAWFNGISFQNPSFCPHHFIISIKFDLIFIHWTVPGTYFNWYHELTSG